MEELDREVLTLRHFEQLSNVEVAQVLGIQERAASMRYIRALRRLKAILETVPGLLD
jgi:RNA polymerase sigma-70 factor (ECF subfamily)